MAIFTMVILSLGLGIILSFEFTKNVALDAVTLDSKIKVGLMTNFIVNNPVNVVSKIVYGVGDTDGDVPADLVYERSLGDQPSTFCPCSRLDKIEYRFTTKSRVTVKSTSAKEIAAMFLYYKQEGDDPSWEMFPGRFEVIDFYTLNDKSSKFFVENGETKVAVFDDYAEASEHAKIINENTGSNYDVYPGGINSDGFIAGPENWKPLNIPSMFPETWTDWDDLPF